MISTPSQKPSGYWKNRNNVITELQRLESSIGHFPTQHDLYDHVLSGLSMAIHRHHGGLRALRQSIGKPLDSKESGYWQDFTNVTREIDALTKELSHYPSRVELKKHLPGIEFAIKTYHGGFIKFRNKMQLKLSRHPNQYWDDAATVMETVRELENQLGYFPTIEAIGQHGPTGLYPAIIRHYGGIREFRKEFSKPLYYPSTLELRVKLLLNRWVADPHYVDGGKKTLQKYGLSLQHPGSKSYLELDRFYFNARVAIEIQGQQHYHPANRFAKQGDRHATLKKQREKDALKRRLLAEQGVALVEIKFDDSDELILQKVAAVLPLRQSPLPLDGSESRKVNQGIDRYSTKESIVAALSELSAQLAAPTLTSTLVRENNPLLYAAIKQRLGSINAARDLLNANHPRRRKGFWSEDQLFQTMKKARDKFGRWPIRSELMEIDGSLVYALKKHGGYNKLKERFRQRIDQTEQEMNRPASAPDI